MKYLIRVTKNSVSSQTIEIEADNAEDAENLAFDEAFCGGEWEDEETISHSIEILNDEDEE